MSYDEGKTRNRDGNRSRDRKSFRNDSEDGRRDNRSRDGKKDFKPRNRDDRRSGNGRDFKSGNRKKFGDRKSSGNSRDRSPVREFSDKPRFVTGRNHLRRRKLSFTMNVNSPSRQQLRRFCSKVLISKRTAKLIPHWRFISTESYF